MFEFVEHVAEHAKNESRLLQVQVDALDWAKQVAALSALDGAVLLDEHLCLRAFGCFVDSDREVECLEVHTAATSADESWREEPWGKAMLVPGGARHRAAATFCKRHEHARAFVVSQDRVLRTFENCGEQVWMAGPMSALVGCIPRS